LWRASFFHVLGIKRIIFALDAWTFFKVRFDPVVLNSLANGGSVIGAILGVATLFAATTSDLNLLNFLGVMHLISLIELITQISDFAKYLDLKLVAADNFEQVLCVRVQLHSTRLLRMQGHGRNC
jgi:hypothetical protein